jgi:hypothetical protein
MPVAQIFKILFLAVGGMLVIAQMVYTPARPSWTYRVSAATGAVIAALAVWGYFEFGDLHQYGPYGRHFYHYHEIYHYYVGAKFYPELGNTQLYDCTYVAWNELAREGVIIPKIRTIRSLENPMQSATASSVLANKTRSCRARFTDQRWSQFKNDLKTLLGLGWYNQWWETALFDLGFNPPPSWNVFGSTLAQIIPLTPFTMELLPWIDITLVLGLASLLIFRAFGLFPTLAYLILFGNNWLSSYRWTGGSYFRQVWFFILVAGICSLQLKRFRTAGLLLGLCSAFRIFPLVFAAGAAIPLAVEAWKSKENRAPFVELVGAAVSSFGISVLCSLIVYGPAHWTEFFQKIIGHNHTYYVMHIGYEKFAVFSHDIGNQDFWYDAGLIRFSEWQDRLSAAYAAQMPLHALVKGTAVALATLASAATTPAAAALVAGSCLFYFFSIPANYYYVYFALFPVLFMSEPLKTLSWLRQALIFSLMVAIPIMPSLSNDLIIQNGYINTAILLFLFALYASYSFGTLAKIAIRKKNELLARSAGPRTMSSTHGDHTG